VDEDKGVIGWVIDGQPGFANFYNTGMNMKVDELDEMETALGYHIVKLTEKTDAIEKVKVAMISRAIEPSSETFQEVYIKASEFAGENNTQAKFDAAVEELGLNKRTSDRLSEMGNRMAGVENGRQVIRWSFSETTTVGKVSPVFEDEKKYVVAILTKIREKGTMAFDEVKEQIRPLVLNQKKADMLIEKINGFGTTDLKQIANKLNASVDSSDLKFTARNIPGFGSEYELIGKIFTLEPGVNSGPIKGNNAVFVVQVDDISRPTAPASFAANATTLQRRFESRITGNSYLSVLKDKVEIDDNRMMFY
jgi:peptidyl-prolyl cis-trans isomerase D